MSPMTSKKSTIVICFCILLGFTVQSLIIAESSRFQCNVLREAMNNDRYEVFIDEKRDRYVRYDKLTSQLQLWDVKERIWYIGKDAYSPNIPR